MDQHQPNNFENENSTSGVAGNQNDRTTGHEASGHAGKGSKANLTDASANPPGAGPQGAPQNVKTTKKQLAMQQK